MFHGKTDAILLLRFHSIALCLKVNMLRIMGERNLGTALTLLLLVAGTTTQQSKAINDLGTCPPNSDGFHPYCSCKYGSDYDVTTNSCSMPMCPRGDSVGTYPNCNCTKRNFEYSSYLNECFRFCPDDSTGYWPVCHCDGEGLTFDKTNFACTGCPEHSTGVYPNCDCGEIGQYEEAFNSCTECTEGSVGKYPNCTCVDDNATFVALTNWCEKCPPGSSGKYPNCLCDNGSTFNVFVNYCDECPYGSVGIPPNCICDDGGYFDGKFCIACPGGSNGSYPDCVCENNRTFVVEFSSCFGCPLNSEGIYPDCSCEKNFQYIKEENSCRSCPADISEGTYPECKCFNGFFEASYEVCVECPANATGIYPNCECKEKTHKFSAYINDCYEPCPAVASGIHPTCKCDNTRDYYDDNERICKSVIGRKCPENAIGVGPDCLCMSEDEQFSVGRWRCQGIFTISEFGSVSCPDGNGKWPQCGSSIDPKVLGSLIG